MQPDYRSVIPAPVIRPDARHLLPARTFQGIPSIEITPRGTLFATWYAGGDGEGPDNFVLVARSRDNGLTWSDAIAVVDPPEPAMRAFDPVLWCDPLGRLWLLWGQSTSPEKGKINDGCAVTCAACCRQPDAETPLWEPSRVLCEGVTLNKPVVAADGSWLLPAAVWDAALCWKSRPAAWESRSGANLYRSTDAGENFAYIGGVAPRYRSFDEHHVVTLRDGTLWMLTRTIYGLAQSFSHDGGRTWSEAVPSAIQGPCSRFFIRRLVSGRLLLVNHDTDRHGGPWAGGIRRDRMTAWLSDDDGRSWHGKLLIDPRHGVTYPDVCQGGDGTLHVIYDYDRYGHGDIVVARFSEDQVAAGGLLDPTSLRTISHSGGVPKT